ncbi:hypothetical protein FACS1894172_20340 [Spirochaetia bacterium]|nr:hypothetical protein FACS1894172_20340 [Spirochaetia bacterium]
MSENVNIYSTPRIDSKLVDSLKLHDKIYVIEDVHNEQEINGTTSCWYKIKYNNTKGFIWGGNIAVETFIFDIDKNNINDYFQYRISWVGSNYHFDAKNDVLIYINGNNISTDYLKRNDEIFKDEIFKYSYDRCTFELSENRAIINLNHGGPNYFAKYTFEMDRDGIITPTNIIIKGEIFDGKEWKIYE